MDTTNGHLRVRDVCCTCRPTYIWLSIVHWSASDYATLSAACMYEGAMVLLICNHSCLLTSGAEYSSSHRCTAQIYNNNLWYVCTRSTGKCRTDICRARRTFYLCEKRLLPIHGIQIRRTSYHQVVTTLQSNIDE